jgi:hypothetical protein
MVHDTNHLATEGKAMTATTYEGPASVECTADTGYWPDCPLANERATAYAVGAWSRFVELEPQACQICLAGDSERPCGWSGKVDCRSDGHVIVFVCPRCQDEVTQPAPGT